MKLKVLHSYLLRFGHIDSKSSGDFIDNINGKFNIYIAFAESNEDEYTCIFANNKFLLKTNYFDENIDDLAKNLKGFCDNDIAKALIQAGYEENIDGFIDHIDKISYEECDKYLYGTGMDDEPKPTNTVEEYINSYFVFTGLTSNCNCEIDSETGEIFLENQTYSNLSDFYGCLDEDSESIQGVKII